LLPPGATGGGGFAEFDPATHAMLTLHHGTREWRPGFPPFLHQDSPIPVENPVAELQSYLAEFTESQL
jgi:hypothetical protein